MTNDDLYFGSGQRSLQKNRRTRTGAGGHLGVGKMVGKMVVEMVFKLVVVAATVLLLGSSAFAQEFAGTFQGTSQAGPVTVTIDMVGLDLAGTLSASGVEFRLEGFVQEGVGVGLAYTAAGSLGFEAYLQGDTLGLYLFEMDDQGEPIVESVVELIMTKQTAARSGSQLGGRPAGQPVGQVGGQPGDQPGGRPSSPLGTPAGVRPPVTAGPVIANGPYGSLTEDNAVAFIEALEFVLAQVGYAYTFTDTDRTQAIDAIAANYATMAQMDQIVLAQAREIWQGVQSNWASASQDEQREFALGVLILAFGEQTVSAWIGPSGGGGQSLGGGSSCSTFEDCTSSFVDEETWSDTFNAQGCWAAAGCGGFDASTNTFDYE